MNNTQTTEMKRSKGLTTDAHLVVVLSGLCEGLKGKVTDASRLDGYWTIQGRGFSTLEHWTNVRNVKFA